MEAARFSAFLKAKMLTPKIGQLNLEFADQWIFFSFLWLLFFMFQVVKDWVKHLTRMRGYPDQMVEEANALIFTFGSYRLGVRLFIFILFSCLMY